MIKIRLNKFESNTIRNILDLLFSNDDESRNLGLSLAKESLNFNMGSMYYHPLQKSTFRSINDSIEFAKRYNISQLPINQPHIVAQALFRILQNGHYWL